MIRWWGVMTLPTTVSLLLKALIHIVARVSVTTW
jgi:hypothetical protein